MNEPPATETPHTGLWTETYSWENGRLRAITRSPVPDKDCQCDYCRKSQEFTITFLSFTKAEPNGKGKGK